MVKILSISEYTDINGSSKTYIVVVVVKRALEKLHNNSTDSSTKIWGENKFSKKHNNIRNIAYNWWIEGRIRASLVVIFGSGMLRDQIWWVYKKLGSVLPKG